MERLPGLLDRLGKMVENEASESDMLAGIAAIMAVQISATSLVSERLGEITSVLTDIADSLRGMEGR